MVRSPQIRESLRTIRHLFLVSLGFQSCSVLRANKHIGIKIGWLKLFELLRPGYKLLCFSGLDYLIEFEHFDVRRPLGISDLVELSIHLLLVQLHHVL